MERESDIEVIIVLGKIVESSTLTMVIYDNLFFTDNCNSGFQTQNKLMEIEKEQGKKIDLEVTNALLTNYTTSCDYVKDENMVNNEANMRWKSELVSVDILCFLKHNNKYYVY